MCIESDLDRDHGEIDRDIDGDIDRYVDKDIDRYVDNCQIC